jgi:hypothetical protein
MYVLTRVHWSFAMLIVQIISDVVHILNLLLLKLNVKDEY